MAATIPRGNEVTVQFVDKPVTAAERAQIRMRCLELGATLRGSTRHDRADLGLDAEASPRVQVVAIARHLEAYVLGEEADR